MPSMEKPFRQEPSAPGVPGSAKKENKEDFAYNKVVEAVNGLHAMATQKQVMPEAIEKHREAISQGIGILQGRLLNRATMQATMPVVLKLKEVFQLYAKDDYFFDVEDKLGIRQASIKANILLDQALAPEMLKGDAKEGSQNPSEDILKAMDSLILALDKNEPLEHLAPDLTTIALNLDTYKTAIKERDIFIKSLPRLIRLTELGEFDDRSTEMRLLAFELMEENLDQMIDEALQGIPDSRESIVRALQRILFEGNDHQAQKAINILEEHKRGLMDLSDEWITNGIFENHTYRSKVVHLWVRLLEKNQDDESLNNAAVRYITEVSGIDGYELFSHWAMATSRPYILISLSDVVSTNFNTMQELEADKKGISKVLNEKFGIYNFGRYPSELLLKQYRERENTELPYGVVFFPYDDHNGSFFKDQEILASLDAQLKDKYLIRIAEGGTKFDIVKLLHRLKRAYGVQHKISFAVIGGHGTTESINFGGGGKRNRLHEMDLADTRARDTKNYFEEDATLILFSCSTGFKNGIGQKISSRLSLKVIAPEKPASPESIVASITDQGINFSVKYRAVTSKEYARGEEVEIEDREF